MEVEAVGKRMSLSRRGADIIIVRESVILFEGRV